MKVINLQMDPYHVANYAKTCYKRGGKQKKEKKDQITQTNFRVIPSPIVNQQVVTDCYLPRQH